MPTNVAPTATTVCPGSARPGPNWQFDFIDFPTGWYLASQGLLHTDRRCSYIQTWGAVLCDCGAIQREWERRWPQDTATR